MGYEGNIQWFPGHMAKTRRIMEQDMKLVDGVVEIVDGRIPLSSRNPVVDELAGSKSRIILLNKCDYADDAITKQWRKYYEGLGFGTLPCDCRSGKGLKAFLPLLKSRMGDIISKRKEKGIVGGTLRVMVVGIPNVGKSSFINRMAGGSKTKVEDRPGVTRGKQWVTIDKGVELLDTPGILWPRFDDKSAAEKLAFTGAIKDEVVDVEKLAASLCSFLSENYGHKLMERYKLESLDGDILENIAKARGMMISGGEPDIRRAASTVLDEFRSGKIGKFTLEKPEKH